MELVDLLSNFDVGEGRTTDERKNNKGIPTVRKPINENEITFIR